MQTRRLLAIVAGPLAFVLVLMSPDRVVSGASYHFQRRPPQAGDAATQDLHFEMNLVVRLTQSQQTIDTSDRGIDRRQRRFVTVLDVAQGRVRRAKVLFVRSQQLVSDGSAASVPAKQAVEGKTYLVARQSDGELQITDPKGNRPPEAEWAIVAQAMDAIGRPNPLAMFLDRRSIAVGQTVALPNEVANDAIGFREAVGEVSRFAMTLVEAKTIGGRSCGVFDVQIDAHSPLDDGQILAVRGRFSIESDTCRIAAIELTCPVAIHQQRGPEGGRFNLEGRGTLQVSMRSVMEPRVFSRTTRR
jgi:hypothetical protein